MILLIRWYVGKQTNKLRQKKLPAEAELLLLYIVFDYGCDATEKVCHTRNLKLIDHICTILSRRQYSCFLKNKQMLRYR